MVKLKLLALLLALSVYIPALIPPAHSVELFSKYPYLQKVSTDSITVMWETYLPLQGIVEWGKTTAYGNSKKDGLATIHEVTISGLKPNTVYHYRVKVGTDLTGYTPSPDSTFMTAPLADQPFMFAVYGDNRRGIEQIVPSLPVFEQFFESTGEGGTNEAHQAVIDAVLAERPRLVVGLGDFVLIGTTPIGYEEFWNWFNIERNLLSFAAFIPIYGNHEGDIITGNIDYNLSLFDEYFSTYANNPNNDETYYSFTYGNSRFIVLNSNQGGDIFASGKPQRIFLENELKSADIARQRGDIKHIFVLYHIPTHPGDSKSPFFGMPSDVLEDMHLLFKNYKVDIVFQAHYHDYQRHLYDGVNYIVTGGGGAPIGESTPDSDTQAYAATLHFLLVTVYGNNVDVIAQKPDGTVIDFFSITTQEEETEVTDETGDTGETGGEAAIEAPGCSIYAYNFMLILLLAPVYMLLLRRILKKV